MRLLNAETRKLETFSGSEIPDYAILSHTWRVKNDEEILFEDIYQKLPEQWPRKPAADKLIGFAEIAYQNGHEWVWMDTCCIDKSSSAELSEAINSMFQWYQDADICYVYLEDVDLDSESQADNPSGLEQFRTSRWFTRGWTLQELLAPEKMQFYDKNWKEIGTKRSLQDAISKATGIQRHVLRGYCSIFECTIAERMCWAANRITGRCEDIAYCLMGIFDVNMPLLYGEGVRAFQRLQEQIIKTTEDYTLFAWSRKQPYCQSVFAPSPAAFKVLLFQKKRYGGKRTMRPPRLRRTGSSSTKALKPWIFRGITLNSD